MNPKMAVALAFILALTLLDCPCFSRSRIILPTAPSPAPGISEGIGSSKGMFGRRHMRKGSSPAVCDSKCNNCKPCMPVQVSVRSMELVENIEYYPQVWRCMCHHNIFSP